MAVKIGGGGASGYACGCNYLRAEIKGCQDHVQRRFYKGKCLCFDCMAVRAWSLVLVFISVLVVGVIAGRYL